MKLLLALVVGAGFVASAHAQSSVSQSRMTWTPKSQWDALGRVVGKSRDQVIGMIGRPNSSYVLDNGAEQWYYSTSLGNAVVYFDRGQAKDWRCGQTNMVWWQLGNQPVVGQVGLGNFSVIAICKPPPSAGGSDN